MAVHTSKKTSWLRWVVSFLPAVGVTVLLCIFFSGPTLGPFYDFLLMHRPAPPVSGELLLIDSSSSVNGLSGSVNGLSGSANGLPAVHGSGTVNGASGSVQDPSSTVLGDDILEPGAAASLLYTMTEMKARTLIIQVPILGLSAGGKAGEAEILYRFDEEFSLLSRNIRNLFDAIRTGSVSPAESARYVGELVDLSDKGKERLVSALVRRDEEGIDSMEKAAAFFGHARRPGDLRVQLITAGEGGRPGVLAESGEYSRSKPDRDGILRRITPVLTVPELSKGDAGERTLEHIIYSTLKTQYKSSEIISNDSSGFHPLRLQFLGIKGGQSLILRNGPDGNDTIIPLDREGAVLFELPHNGENFRRIGISDFLAYDEADRELRRLLVEAESLGIFQGIQGEDQPLVLYDYALSLREQLASSAAMSTADPKSPPQADSKSLPQADSKSPPQADPKSPPQADPKSPSQTDEEKKQIWIESRNRYFTSLENFLYGLTEMNLVEKYEEIIAGEPGNEKLTEMRDSLIRTFVILRTKYNEVLELRKKLESALSDSFCILGSRSSFPAMAEQASGTVSGLFPRIAHYVSSTFHRTGLTDMEASALLANSILTGRVVKPGEDGYLLLSSILWVFLTCFFIKSFGPALTLGLGAFLTLFVTAVFSWSFIFSGLWLDPLVPASASGTGVVVSFSWAVIAKIRSARRFRLAFGPFVSPACLGSIIREGKPLPSQTVTAWTAVVAVRNSDPAFGGESSSLLASAALSFQQRVSDVFKRAGGTIIGTEGDIVIVCFGSPLERVFLGGRKKVSPYEDNIHALSTPALRAVDVIQEIVKHSECKSWRFGVDLGNCTFFWTAISGYSAQGIPVQRARILSRMAGRYRTRIVISSSANEALPDMVAAKLGVLNDKNVPEGVPFYSLAIRG